MDDTHTVLSVAQTFSRPHPNECSGSDLDGDVYFVSWDPELIPARMAKPMEYAPAPKMELDHDVTIELAKLFSIAVDFPKTGIPAEIPTELQVKEYPDFMEKQDKVTYESKGIIGKLYRAIKDHKPDSVQIKTFTKQVAARSYDADMEVDGYEEHLNDAFFFKEEYDFKLGNLMDHYGIKTEVEIISGNIMKMSKIFTKNRDAEAIGKAVRALRKEARSWFKDKQSDHEHDEDEENAKASAWYYVTYHPSYWGCYNEGLKRPHFLSFPWCVYDKLTQIKQKKISKRKAASEVSLLQNRMRGLLIDGRR